MNRVEADARTAEARAAWRVALSRSVTDRAELAAVAKASADAAETDAWNAYLRALRAAETVTDEEPTP